MADYGSDISTFPDLDPWFGLKTGPRVVGEAVARRFITSNLFYDPNYGYNIRLLLNSSLRPEQVGHIAAAARAEALKDERVQDCQVNATYNGATFTLKLQVLLLLGDGPFPLTLTITPTDQVAVFGSFTQ